MAKPDVNKLISDISDLDMDYTCKLYYGNPSYPDRATQLHVFRENNIGITYAKPIKIATVGILVGNRINTMSNATSKNDTPLLRLLFDFITAF